MKPSNLRILVADDLVNIHEDFAKILTAATSQLADVPGLARFAPELLVSSEPTRPAYELNFVTQGEEAVRAVTRAQIRNQPYAVAFLDVRMPPGIDGVETAGQLLKLDPELQIVLCTAYTDYSFAEISVRFGGSPNFLILKKPFDPAEVVQIALALTHKWELQRRQQRLQDALREASSWLAQQPPDPRSAALRALADES